MGSAVGSAHSGRAALSSSSTVRRQFALNWCSLRTCCSLRHLDGRVEHHLMREAMARVVKGKENEKEVATRSARSGVCSQTGATLVKRGLYCAVRVRCALRVAVCAHRLAQLLQREACTVLCASVVPCVRVQCARALRVHTRGYTHLISANGFGCDAQKELPVHVN